MLLVTNDEGWFGLRLTLFELFGIMGVLILWGLSSRITRSRFANNKRICKGISIRTRMGALLAFGRSLISYFGLNKSIVIIPSSINA